MKPNYNIPIPVLADLAFAFLFFRRRSFRVDAARMAAIRKLPTAVYGRENTPLRGPGVVTINHYCSPKFWSPWIAVAVSALVPVDIYWTISAAWTFPGMPLSRLRRSLSKLLLLGLARTYGFNSMPPMPPDPSEVAERSASVYRIIQYTRDHPNGLLGMAPEGGDQPGGKISLPPNGVGRLALALARKDVPFYPVGLYEGADGVLKIHFGQPYRLEIDSRPMSLDVDLMAREKMMRAIAGCLPEHLRGPFG